MQEEMRWRTWEAPWAPGCGKAVVRYTDIEARKGKPGYRAMAEPKGRTGKRCGKAEKYCERESPPHADGESYQA
jgi:hypothetical protein